MAEYPRWCLGLFLIFKSMKFKIDDDIIKVVIEGRIFFKEKEIWQGKRNTVTHKNSIAYIFLVLLSFSWKWEVGL